VEIEKICFGENAYSKKTGRMKNIFFQLIEKVARC
jgi:hypothetical protein